MMGEVRVRATLTNAGDEVLVRRGLLTEDRVRSYEADALIDTGAVPTVLPPYVVQQLGLAICGQRMAEYADGRKDSVGSTEPVIININGRDTVDEALVLGDEVIIGQTVLERLDLCCKNQDLRLQSRTPEHELSDTYEH